MAGKINTTKKDTVRFVKKHLTTSIGRGLNSRPLNKHKRLATKPYRGQGKP